MSVNDPPSLALTQMLAAGFRLVFDSWTHTNAELCTSAYETLLRLSPAELDPYQRIVYAHILMVQGKYTEALDLCERGVSEASVSGVGQVVNFLAHFGALSAETMIFLRKGQLGKVLQITKAGRASPDENMSLYWLLTLRAWHRSSKGLPATLTLSNSRRVADYSGVRGSFPNRKFVSCRPPI